jgi:hypothetical protein
MRRSAHAPAPSSSQVNRTADDMGGNGRCQAPYIAATVGDFAGDGARSRPLAQLGRGQGRR